MTTLNKTPKPCNWPYMDLNRLDKPQLIDEIKQLRVQLEQQQYKQYSHEFLASFIEQVPIPLAILKVERDIPQTRFVYQFVNSAVTKLNNKNINQHLGHSLQDVLENEAIAADIHANFEKVIETQQTSIREINVPIEGALGRLIEYHFPIKQNGKVSAVGAALIDITKLTQAVTEAETANKAKSTFLSQMSHEIRTPMNSIMGFAQLLVMQSKQNELSDKQMQCLNHIQNSGEQLLHIIDDLLDLSRIEAGKIHVDIQDIDLNNLVQNAVSSMKNIANNRDINIIIQDKSQFLHAVRADKVRLTQVIINLLSNAIKYNKKVGTVTLFTQLLPQQKLRINVQDYGLGISKSQQPNLFKPFERLGHENGPIPGSGIGLHICKKIMDALDGDINFGSEEGHGSRFWIDIPLSNDNSFDIDPHATTNKKALSDSKNNILYVQDNPQDMMFMEMLVEKSLPNYNLIVAPNGELAMDLARIHAPKVILLDIRLPGLNGLQLFKSLKTISHLKNCPIIAVTAEATHQDIEKGMTDGFYAYLTKPMDMSAMVSTVFKAAQSDGN